MEDGGVVRLEGEERVEEEGAFKDGVDEEVEGVPDEEDAEAAGDGCVEGTEGEMVGTGQEADDGEKGDDCCLVDDRWRSRHCYGFCCGCRLDCAS
jgi:hypothetical protein